MNEEIKNRKLELQKELSALSAAETKQAVKEYYHKFKEYEGKFFKTRNSYATGRDWMLYRKVTKVTASMIYTSGENVLSHYEGWSFQTDHYGAVTVEKERNGYIHSLGEEITESEFLNAWNKMADKLNNL